MPPQESIQLIFGKLDLLVNLNTTLLKDLRAIEKKPEKVAVRMGQILFRRGDVMHNLIDSSQHSGFDKLIGASAGPFHFVSACLGAFTLIQTHACH